MIIKMIPIDHSQFLVTWYSKLLILSNPQNQVDLDPQPHSRKLVCTAQ
jgi:hypothetical protein